MRNPLERIVDTWAALSHHAAIGDGNQPVNPLAPSWVGRHNMRRLQAYTILQSYIANVSRWHMQFGSEEARASHREYGEPELVIQRIRAAVLGGEPRALVAGADGQVGNEPTEDDATDATPLTVLMAEWEQERVDIEAAVERQEWFDRQFTDDRAGQKIIACENTTVGLGDGVYLLAWSNAKGRVRVRTYEPGFYFPVAGDDDDDYPDRVHLAWEIEDDDGVSWVRRITFDRHLLPGVETRRYPYQDEGDEPSRYTVTMTDARWKFDGLGDRHVNDFDINKAVIGENSDGLPLQDFDLGIDFVPVVHVPHTIPESTGSPWGKSALLRVAQILDDIAKCNTDIAATGALLGSPPISIESDTGIPAETLTYGPGQVFAGRVTMLDTSKSLDALLKQADYLLATLSVNRELPQSILGRVQPSDVPSGIALLLSFGPFVQMIEDARLVRADKYRLLCKFWQRLAIVGGTGSTAAGALPPGSKVLDTGLALGSYLPTDIDSVVKRVIDLVKAHVISVATGLRMLQAVGVDIEDIEAEAEAAARENFEGAQALADAVQNEAPAWERLGLNPDDYEDPTPPAPPAGVNPFLPDTPVDNTAAPGEEPPAP